MASKNKILKNIIFSTTLLSLALSNSVLAKKQKSIVGQVEDIKIEELGLNFLARIDTGAATTSIHAEDINVIGTKKEYKDLRKHLGERVSFTAVNEKGEKATYEAEIVKVMRVRNAQGVERRFIVNLTLNWNGEKKKIQVNLRDRKKLDYKLLIGRNWLEGDYLVDVEKDDYVLK